MRILAHEGTERGKIQMKKNKIVLVNPGVHFLEPAPYGMYPNTAIMILATILHNAGFSVKVIDGRYYRVDDAVNLICSEISDDLAFIGFSVMTVQVPWAYYVSQAIKSKGCSCQIVWGGVHPTLFPDQTIEDPAVDTVVINEAAATVVSLAEAYFSGEADALAAVPGIYYKNGGRIRRNGPNRLNDDFGNIPYFDFSLLDHERYSRNNNIAIEEFYGGRYKDCRVYPIITALSCTYKCTFCINVILGRKYCFRGAPEIIDRIKFLKKAFGADFIQPMDENFFINKKRTFDFLDLLEKEDLGIKWRPQVRADYFNENYIDLETAKRLDRSGMIVAAMGVESASQDMLDRLRKQMKVESIMKAVEILSKTNIVPKMNFMVGLPGESEEDIMKTYSMAVEIRRRVKKSCVTVSPFRPYPGSQLYDQCIKEYGYVPPSSLREWATLSKEDLVEGRGYESFEDYKWIKNPGRLRAVQGTYEEIAWYRPQRDDKLHGKLRNMIASLRFKFGLFALVDFEKNIFESLSALKKFFCGKKAVDA